MAASTKALLRALWAKHLLGLEMKDSLPRQVFHASLLSAAFTYDSQGMPSNSDRTHSRSVAIAQGVFGRMLTNSTGVPITGCASEHSFESLCAAFIRDTFLKLNHLRPGDWDVHQVSGRRRLEIAKYEQYAHLVALDRAAKADRELAAALGSDYTITPDIVVARALERDASINRHECLVDDSVSTRASLRAAAGGLPLLHASVSCKWTIVDGKRLKDISDLPLDLAS
ncbi:NgoMIV family type II restriction endonuclease [Pseudomonas sp. Pseu.R1]|uniref:NgoMIV family type II restriction endonuclease n=1 Tax=Pseudomonas sp. Pseu.R1 TaxID=3379818 RepID=UPI003B9658F9